jgi:hypothetical protein
MFKTIDSLFSGPYSERIETAINQTLNTIYQKDPEAHVILATRYTPESGADFDSKWPGVWTVLQRDEGGDIRILLGVGTDPFVELGAWILHANEIEINWLQFPFERDQ